MSQEKPAELFSRREAAKRQGCCYETICRWESRGWLTPAPETPRRYTAEALDAAAAKAAEARRDGILKAQQVSHGRNAEFERGNRMKQTDAAKYLNVARHTIQKWRKSCPYLPNQRGIRHWPENSTAPAPIYVATSDIKRIESKINGDARATANERMRPIRTRNILAAVAKRRREPKGNLGSAADAAVWARVSQKTIRRAHKRRDLESISEIPLRFDRDVVKKWAAEQDKTEDDLPIKDIPRRISGPSGKIYPNGQTEKLMRIQGIIKRLGTETYWRKTLDTLGRRRKVRCISKELFPDIKDEYLALMNFVEDELRPGEIKIVDAAEIHAHSLGGKIKAYKIIRDKLAEHAPADCVRTVHLKNSGSRNGRGARYTARVAPLAAIEAALRGESWTQSDADTLTQEAVESDAELPDPADYPKSKAKRERGRPTTQERDEYIEEFAKRNQLVGQHAIIAERLNSDDEFRKQFGIEKDLTRTAVRLAFKRLEKRRKGPRSKIGDRVLK